MNINFEKAEAAGAQTNVGRDTTSYRTPQSAGKVDGSGIALDISGTVMDNSAYAGHGRTAEEVMLEAGQEDIAARRNYMAVMSNSMSDEDFAKLQEEGFHPGSTDIETVVTIVDHIKAALIRSGAQISGYTDTVSEDKLKEIMGSEVLAQELVKQFGRHDIPVTEESASLVAEAWNMLKEVSALSEDSIKYMVENDRSPTPESLYMARFSATEGSARQGKGYYADGSVAGYYAKKPESIHYESLLPQMKRVIEEAGYEADEEGLSDAKWLVENGILLNADTYSRLQEIKALKFPISGEDFLQAAACAVSDGRLPAKADLSQKESRMEQAVRILEDANTLLEETADIIVARDLPLTLKNLKAAQDMLNKQEQTNQEQAESGDRDGIWNIRGRRLLEEVRLSMTAESNLRLLRRGFQIETAPLEELVEALKAAEKEIEAALTKEADAGAAGQKTSLYRQTLYTLQGIQAFPAAVLARISEADLLPDVYQKGAVQAAEYEKAGAAYETLMTAPRMDMGDSISKAFRNVDDILTDLGVKITEASRRAVRILGYNELEVNAENIKEIEKKDELLSSVVERMKPGRVLEMIRQGINPLEMPLSELSEYLEGQTQTAQEMDSYSKFLYKLEKQNGISEEERSAFIGIYRLARQLEKADNAAVGALWEMRAEFTLENLLTANRSMKRTNKEYTVDDRFGGVSAIHSETENIISQIQKGFAPDKKELDRLLEQAGSSRAQEEFEQLGYEQIRTAVRSEEAVLRQLTDYGQPVTADHLQAMQVMLKTPADIWRSMGRFIGGNKGVRAQTDLPEEEKASGESVGAADEGIHKIFEASEPLMKAMDSRWQMQEAYEGFTSQLQDILESRAFSEENGALDVKAMSTLYRQMSFLAGMAREENYEIPVNLDGSLTTINLKLIHKGRQESRVAVTLETEGFGKTAAEFQMTEKGLSGICICSSQRRTELFKKNQSLLDQKLEDEKIRAGEIYFAAGEKLDLTEFSLKESEGREQGAGAGELYRAARAFIGFVQETAQRKEAEYENKL